MTTIKSITNKYQSSTVKWINRNKSQKLSIMMMAIILIIINLILTHSVNGLSSIDESESRKLFGGYRITPKFCRASKTLPKTDPRSNGPTICMFNHECAQRNGEVVGACMDGFLFGACCQVPGIVDTTLIQSAQKRPQSSPNLAAAYETFGNQQVNSNEQINNDEPSGNFYDTNSELENDSIQLDNNNNNNYNINSLDNNKNTNQFYVENESVLVSSPSTNQFNQRPYQKPINNQVTSTKNNTNNQLAEFSTEIPMKIISSNGQYGHTSEDSVIIQSSTTTNKPQTLNPNDILNNGEFTHSDITHPGAESILIEDDLQFSTGYGPSTVYITAPENLQQQQQQQSTDKVIINYQKPVFKPKPIVTSTKKPNDGYVLVQTLTNNNNNINNNNKHTSKRPNTEDGMTTNNIESIESIILMLNESNHGPSYNLYNSTTEPTKVTFSSSFGTRKPVQLTTTNKINYDNYSPTNYYITTNQLPLESSTHIPISSSVRPTFSNHYSSSSSSSSTPIPLTTLQPPYIQSDDNIIITKQTATTSRPTISTTQQNYILSSTNHPIIITSSGTKRPTVTAFKRPQGQNNNNYNNNNEIIITPTRKPGTRRPINKPPSTSYVTGPTPPRLPSTISFTGGSSTLPTQSDEDNVKINVGVSGGGGGGGSTNNYLSSQYVSSTQNIIENVQQSDNNDGYKPVYVQLLPVSTTQRPHPTVIITPKPTISNLGTSTVPSSPWTPNIIKYTTTQSQKQPSTSYIYSPIVTRRPDYSSSTAEYVSLPPISSNDFDDPGYYGIQLGNTNRPQNDYNPLSVTENLYTITGNDDRPVFPGYYGPTRPSYSTFNVPTAVVEKNDDEEETYTSPNDFVNFPPVRNPNLNMSATSSSVTTDFEMSTPAFVEDNILNDKMSLLVNKIVDSLQGNFEALAELVENDNSTRAQISTTGKPTKSTQSQTKQTTKLGTTRRPITKKTQKPNSPNRGTTSTKPLTTKRIVTTTTTTKKPIVTRKPTATRRPAVTHYTTKKPTKLTNKPGKTTKPSKGTKPTRKVTKTTTPTTTTTVEPSEADEIVEENNIEYNEIEEDESAEETRKIQCGARPHVKSGRIVGGKGAVFGEWPWQVLVRESTWLGLFTKNKCGGVLITNKFVMTAAHCQPGFLASLVAVFGEFDISGDLETKRSVTKNVKKVVVHRQYDAATFENDLALLELESLINYDTHIVPICMPTDNADFTGRMATVTGWGRLKYGGGVPSVLQEVQVPIIENSVCQEMFHTAGHNKKILTSFLCAGYANGQKDSCEGDSGGPLVLQRSDGRWELAGTVSHGIKCAAPYLPGVYMRTTFYKPWLKSVTGIK